MVQNQGKEVSLHRADKGGGFIQDVIDVAFPIDDFTQANPGVANILPATVLPRSFKQHTPILDAGPFSVTVAGVTGANAANLNGSRTATRTEDNAISIGVDTGALAYDATLATITGLGYTENDPEMPSRRSFDVDVAIN